MDNKYTILVVDDSKANIDTFMEFLSPLYDIFVAIDGATALEIVESETINLIILDIFMPDISGYEVAKSLKSDNKTKDIPIIFITANSNENSIENAYNAGGSDYIVNPFKPKELLARVDTQLSLVQRTNDLEKLNHELESRIEEEVEKNRQKDKTVLAQSQLAQMGEMISMIAHQWRQPLNAISLTSNNLQIKIMLDEVDTKLFYRELSLIEDYSQHLSETIDDFRGFFKEDKDKNESSYKELVEDTLAIIRTSIESKHITIDMKKLSCKDKFITYTNEVKQVLLNIFKNAEDALLVSSIENPTITIETICNIEKKCVLLIKDNAGGIPKDILPKIFDPYFSTKTERDGTGLGLYMSKIIIEEHCGGRIDVYNDEDGAVFKLELKI